MLKKWGRLIESENRVGFIIIHRENYEEVINILMNVMGNKYMTKNIINIIISVMLMLALSHCDNRQQTKQTEEEKNVALITFEAEKTMADSIIASESELLQNQLHEYDSISRLYMKDRPWIPYCEQCSDLELLLIAERELGTRSLVLYNQCRSYRIFYDPIPNIIGVVHLTKKNIALIERRFRKLKDYGNLPLNRIKGLPPIKMKNDAGIKRKLRDVEAQYSDKFNIPPPWWWICSVDERIRRLEAAIETNKGYPYYPVEDSAYYRMGKAMATYEMWFKRPLPECTKASCSEDERFKHAEQALDVGLPYFSEEEDITFKDNLKAEYKKMFGVPIPDYWLSVARIYYYHSFSFGSGPHYISVTRTASGGAVAREIIQYVSGMGYYSLELGMKDWLNFINALDKLSINRWEKRNLPPTSHWWYDGKGVVIFTLNGKNDSVGGYCVGDIEINEYLFPPHIGKGIQKIFDDMQVKIRKRDNVSYQ